MTAVEALMHRLDLVVRVVDHFSGRPWPSSLEVAVGIHKPVRAPNGRDARQSDGTYRFINIEPGTYQLHVVAPDNRAFVFETGTFVTLPLNPVAPVNVEIWPTPAAPLPTSATIIRGSLVTGAGGAVPVANQEIELLTGGRSRRSRSNANGEFVFPLIGPVALTDGAISLTANCHSRTLTSIQVADERATSNSTFTGPGFSIAPGHETRAVFFLS